MRSISPYERHGVPAPVTDAQLKIHVFTAVDTLTLLAHKYYGDWRLWRVIAERNKIVDPRRIPIGAELIVPLQPLEKGAYEI